MRPKFAANTTLVGLGLAGEVRIGVVVGRLVNATAEALQLQKQEHQQQQEQRQKQPQVLRLRLSR
jgi:hypothetical protein